MDVKIRQATLEDKERIGHFLRVAYQDRAQYKFPARWLWEYVGNPFWDGERLPIWIAEVDGKIVAQNCSMAVPLKLGDRVYQAAWGADLIVLPEYRGRGIARLLIKVQQEYHDSFVALTMSPASRKVFGSLGGEVVNTVVELGKIPHLDASDALNVLDAKLGKGNILVRGCRRLKLGGMVALALNFVTRLRDVRRLRGRDHSLVIESVERFGGEIDRLWEQLAPFFPAIVQRNAEYLNWKFVDQPHMQYERFVARRAGVVCGYVITRRGTPPEPNAGVIADVFASPDEDSVLRALLVHATRHLQHAGVKAIIAASSVSGYVAHFLRLGFKETGQLTPMFRCEGTAGRNLTDWREDWFFSMGDHDWDQYPLL